MAVSAACFSTEWNGFDERPIRNTDILEYKIKDLKEDLDTITLRYSSIIPEPMYALDEPQYNYFFICGQISAYNDCLRLIKSDN